MKPGPSLDALVRRLSETPPEFLAEPRIGDVYHSANKSKPLRRGHAGVVHVDAVVGDLLRHLGAKLVKADELQSFTQTHAQNDRNWLRIVLIASWLCHDEWFVRQRYNGQPIHGLVSRILREEFVELAQLVKAEDFVNDADRREELVRLVLFMLDYHPDGETPEQAADRLDTVSTVDRHKVVKRMKAQQERARLLREEMERQRAQEAAARYSRE